MTAMTLDSLKALKTLEEAGFERKTAEAMVGLLTQASGLPDTSTLATKTDLAEVKSEILKWMFGQTLLILSVVAALLKFSH
jgi:hypothetical protein